MLKNILSTLFTKGFIAMLNLAILLISSKQLGSESSGYISLLIVNIAIIQIINEVYTGYTLVYFIPKFSLKKLYSFGVLWTLGCNTLCAIAMYVIYTLFNIGDKHDWTNLVGLSFIIIFHSFHMVILLAKEKIKLYNFLNLLQPLLLLLSLVVFVFVFRHKTTSVYIMSLYISFFISIIFSSYFVFQLFKNNISTNYLIDKVSVFTNGFYNQLAILAHLLSNRYNFYLLGNAVLVGVYSRASSLIESVWIISGSVSPIILTYIANSEVSLKNAKLTLTLAKICLALSMCCVLVLYLLPNEFFVYLLGNDFIHVKTVMLYLSPGILCISFSTIISHYFAGLGKQKKIVTANLMGFFTTICTSWYLVPKYQLLGACYATSLSYFVAALTLTILFIRHNRFSVTMLFSFKEEFKKLKKE